MTLTAVVLLHCLHATTPDASEAGPGWTVNEIDPVLSWGGRPVELPWPWERTQGVTHARVSWASGSGEVLSRMVETAQPTPPRLEAPGTAGEWSLWMEPAVGEQPVGPASTPRTVRVAVATSHSGVEPTLPVAAGTVWTLPAGVQCRADDASPWLERVVGQAGVWSGQCRDGEGRRMAVAPLGAEPVTLEVVGGEAKVPPGGGTIKIRIHSKGVLPPLTATAADGWTVEVASSHAPDATTVERELRITPQGTAATSTLSLVPADAPELVLGSVPLARAQAPSLATKAAGSLLAAKDGDPWAGAPLCGWSMRSLCVPFIAAAVLMGFGALPLAALGSVAAAAAVLSGSRPDAQAWSFTGGHPTLTGLPIPLWAGAAAFTAAALTLTAFGYVLLFRAGFIKSPV